MRYLGRINILSLPAKRQLLRIRREKSICDDIRAGHTFFKLKVISFIFVISPSRVNTDLPSALEIKTKDYIKFSV